MSTLISGARWQATQTKTAHETHPTGTKPFISHQFSLDMSHLTQCCQCRAALIDCGVSELAFPEVYAQHAGTCEGCRRLTKSCMKEDRGATDRDDRTDEKSALRSDKSPLPELNKSANKTGGAATKPLKFTIKDVVALQKRVAMLQFQVMFLAALHLWGSDVTSIAQVVLLVATFWWTSDATLNSVAVAVLLVLGWQWLSDN